VNKNNNIMKTHKTTTAQKALKIFGFFALCLMLSAIANPLHAQENERTVTGVVTSIDGPLLGASVMLKGTAYGVMTNDDGTFVFPEALKEDDVLVVSYLGYETAEIKIEGNTTFVEPYLKDIAVVIIANLRTVERLDLEPKKQN